MNQVTMQETAAELYEKGCQEKKLRLDRNRDLILDIQPTSYMPRWRSFAFLFS
jgi:hypothetical protein